MTYRPILMYARNNTAKISVEINLLARFLPSLFPTGTAPKSLTQPNEANAPKHYVCY